MTPISKGAVQSEISNNFLHFSLPNSNQFLSKESLPQTAMFAFPSFCAVKKFPQNLFTKPFAFWDPCTQVPEDPRNQNL